MANNRVAVITNAGGLGVLTTDAFAKKRIVLAELSEKTKTALRKILPEESTVENPIDLLGDAKDDRYKKVLQIIEKDPEIGAVICLLTPQDQTPVEKISRVITKFNSKSKKAVVASFVGGKKVEKGIKKLRGENIFNFAFPESAVSILDAYYRWSLKGKGGAEKESDGAGQGRKAKVEEAINLAESENRHSLYFVFRQFNIRPTPND